MKGLIPLALKTGYDSSRFGDSPTKTSTTSRIASPGKRPLKPYPLAVPSLRQLPKPAYSTSDWKVFLAEIKRDHMNKKFRQCAERCIDLLKHADYQVLMALTSPPASPPSNANLLKAHVQPAYLVYLNFYAATCLEAQALALPPSSADCMADMLEEARRYYIAASDLAQQADETISRNSFSSGHTHSPMSSFHSACSDDSQSTASTRMSSPTPSLSPILNKNKATEPMAKPKKRVAFRDLPIVEPAVRPDSPTLGFDSWLSRSSEIQSPHSILHHEGKMPLKVDTRSATDTYFTKEEEDEADPFFRARSIHRYCTILASIRQQVTFHLAAINREILRCRSMGRAALDGDTRAQDFKSRIERLRANNWQRPRFDARRYELLRENALADLAA